MAKKSILQLFIIKELIHIEMYNIHLIDTSQQNINISDFGNVGKLNS